MSDNKKRKEVAVRCSTGRRRRGDAHGIEENISETRHAQIKFARGNSAARFPPVRPRDPGTMLTRAGAKKCSIKVGGATGLASHSWGLDLGFLLLINNMEA